MLTRLKVKVKKRLKARKGRRVRKRLKAMKLQRGRKRLKATKLRRVMKQLKAMKLQRVMKRLKAMKRLRMRMEQRLCFRELKTNLAVRRLSPAREQALRRFYCCE